MKQVLFLFILHLLISPIYASEGFTTLIVWAKDGSKVAYQLKDKPILTFQGSDLVIKTNDLTVNYALKQMLRFTFENTQNVANTILSKNNDIPFSMNTEYLLFPSLKKGSSVFIYSVDGKIVLKRTINYTSDVSIPIQQLQSGVYFVQVNGITYKIIKK